MPPVHWTGDPPAADTVALVLLRLFPDTTTGSLLFVRVELPRTTWDGEAVPDLLRSSVRPAIDTLLERSVPTVAELLEASRAAHRLYRQLNAQDRLNIPPQKAAIQDASDQRAAANAADPGHLDPAWAIDLPTTDAELQAFYQAYLLSH